MAPGVSREADEAARALLGKMNARQLAANPEDDGLAARIAAYELAGRMQLSVPAIADLSTETAATLKMAVTASRLWAVVYCRPSRLQPVLSPL